MALVTGMRWKEVRRFWACLHCSVLLQSNCPVPATTPVPAAAVVVDSCLVLVEIASYDEWCLLFLPISVGV